MGQTSQRASQVVEREPGESLAVRPQHFLDACESTSFTGLVLVAWWPRAFVAFAGGKRAADS